MVASFIPRRVRRVAGGAVVLLGLAGAAACGTQDGVPQTIAIVGSDTTQDVMGAIANEYDSNNPANYNPDPDNNENVLAISSVSPDPGHTVPGDGVTSCGTKTYRTPPGGGQVARPNGSGAGRDALLASVQAGDGCIDVARSSAGPRAIGSVPGTDLASFEYYAYALDAVGATTGNATVLGGAARNLTLTELRNIYNCTWDNWSEGTLGGPNVPIIRYWPQAGSGTRSFAQSALLGFDPTTFSTATCPAVELSQENTGLEIFNDGNVDEAIFVYSVANWSAMSQGTITDDRRGQAFFALDDTSDATIGSELPVRSIGGGQFEPRFPTAGDPAPNAPIHEGNTSQIDPTPAYPGVRYVWNVIDNSTGANSYTPAKRFVGFDNVASPAITSPLCNGDKAATLVDFGFAPLDKTADATHNVPGTACRLW